MKLKRMFSFGALIFILLAAMTVTAVQGVEPAHDEPSKEYLTSKYYAQLSSVELTGDERTDVVLVALSQLGYHEGNSEADMGGGNMSGEENFVEYNRLYGVYNQETGLGYDWCCAFATWCLHTADASFVSKTHVGMVRCSALLELATSRGISKPAGGSYAPKSGDLIFFSNKTDKTPSHIGIVLYSDSSRVYTIEGNAQEPSINISGQYVSLKDYSLTDTYIVGYASPNYTVKADKAIDFTEDRVGTHYITTASLNIRSGPSISHSLAGSVTHGKLVNVTEINGGWGKIKYGGVEGWISLAFAQYVPSDCYTVYYNANGGNSVTPAQPNPVGESIKINPTAPTRPGYKFAGWTTAKNANVPEYAAGGTLNVDGDVTLTAVWTLGNFKVKFYDGDKLLKSEEYGHGAIVTPPETPTRAGDDLISYRFEGWDKNGDGKTDIKLGDKITATDDLTLNAVFVQELTQHRVVFLDKNDKVISEKKYTIGEKLVAPTPAEVPDIYEGAYRYVFNEWDKKIPGVVTGPAVFKATYTQEDAKYKVTFVDGDGKTLKTEECYYGDKPTAPTETPTKTADSRYTYKFKDWDKAISEVKGETVYTAVFEEIPVEYTITFVGYDGKVLETKKYQYADIPQLSESIGTARPADETYFYTFTGWSPAIAGVSEDATYTAQYSLTKREYIVTFFNHDGSVYKTQNYNYGDTIVMPEPPVREGYTFEKWTPTPDTVTGNMSFTSHFILNPIETTTGDGADEIPEPDGGPALMTGIVIALVVVIVAAAGFVVFIIIKNSKNK